MKTKILKMAQSCALACVAALAGCVSVSDINSPNSKITQEELVEIGKGNVWNANNELCYAAIDKIDSEQALYDVAKNGKYRNLCQRAVERMTDQELLYKLATEDRHVDEAAISRLTDQEKLLSIIMTPIIDEKTAQNQWTARAENIMNGRRRRAAMKHLPDQSPLIDIYNNSHANLKIKVDAVASLKDQEVLKRIALNDENAHIRGAAMGALEDATFVAGIKTIDAILNPHKDTKSQYTYEHDKKEQIQKIMALTVLAQIKTGDYSKRQKHERLRDKYGNYEEGYDENGVWTYKTKTITKYQGQGWEVESDESFESALAALKTNKDMRGYFIKASQKILADYVEKNVSGRWGNSNIIKGAIQLIDDQTFLSEYLASHGSSEDEKLLNRIEDQQLISRIATSAKSEDIKIAAISNLTDQVVIERIAKDNVSSPKVRKAAITKLENQLVLADIAKTDGYRDVRIAAVNMISDQAMLIEIAQMEKGKYQDEVLEAAFARVDIAKAIKSIAESEIAAFVISGIEKFKDNYGSERFKQDIISLRKAVELFKVCQSDANKADLLFAVLSRLADIRKTCKSDMNLRSAWGDEFASELLSSIKDEKMELVIKAVLLRNSTGWDWIIDWISQETASEVLSAKAIKSEALEIALAKLVPPETITPEIYANAQHDKTKNILHERMPKSVLKAIDKANEEHYQKLLAKAEENGKDTFCLKGFYLGMPVEDAKELVRYYLPTSNVVITKKNNIEIDVEHGGDMDFTPMYFCQSDNDGRVCLFNFDKRFLRQWFRYDVQNYREWAVAFGREFNIPFRQKDTKGKFSWKYIEIRVTQEVYSYKHNINGYVVSFFGEKDVWDPYSDPTWGDILDGEASAYRAGVIMRGKAWVENDWENGDGAREGTLRVRKLNNND